MGDRDRDRHGSRERPDRLGDPASIQALADAAEDTASKLDELRTWLNRDVLATIPGLWKGPSATRFGQTWQELTWFLATDAEHNYAERLAVDARMMSDARWQLDEAQKFIDANGLVLRPDLTVEADNPDSNDPDLPANINSAQGSVNATVRTAERAQALVAAANEDYQRHRDNTSETVRDYIDKAITLGGMRGGRRGRRGKRRMSEDELGWGPEGKIRLPKDGTGTWSGEKGNSTWTPNRPGDVGLRPGDAIEFKDGVPDLAEYSPPPEKMPGGASGIVDEPGLNGYYKHDAKLGDEELARRFGSGWTPEKVKEWREANDYVYHHYSRTEMQLVPGRINGSLTHQGSASELRGDPIRWDDEG